MAYPEAAFMAFASVESVSSMPFYPRFQRLGSRSTTSLLDMVLIFETPVYEQPISIRSQS
jgi:hypothetical protein